MIITSPEAHFIVPT